MQVAVFSDIHANLPAFEAVLRDSDEVGVEERWCLGDIVGYGADPDLCVDRARDRCEVCLVGNHDLAVLGELDTSTFSTAAAAAVEWTAEHTERRNLDYLASLSPTDTSRAAALYHASPRDPVWEYVLWPEQAADCLEVQEKRVSFVGHSHVALFFSAADGNDDGEAHGWQAGAGTRLEIGDGRWLINPGSVGQPRDGDPRAAWLELDTESWEATYHRVGYDIERAARSIEAAGLPEHLGRRLFQGR
ncbi:MAG TPA: metallophosphoesterase family protein [Solirubrobacterales bacterium]|nr:metallophosphoesterase family protein [Solirubrobacterales bacterium]